MRPNLKYYLALFFILFRLSAQAQQFVWERNFGNANCFGHNFAKGLGDEFYVSGIYTDSLDFDPGPGVLMKHGHPDGYFDVWMAKYDTTGALDFVNTWGGAGSDGGSSVSVDAMGNIHMVVRYATSFDADPGPGVVMITGGPAYAVIKMSPSGGYLWSLRLGDQNVMGHRLDDLGNLLIYGHFDGTVDFDPGLGVVSRTATGTWDPFLLKLDPSGNFMWAVTPSGTGLNSFGELGFYPGGDLCVIGTCTTGLSASIGTLDLDPGPGSYLLYTPSALHSFCARYDAGGNFVSALTFGDTAVGSAVILYTMHVRPTGEVLLAGSIGDSLADLDPSPGVAFISSPFSTFTLELDPVGNLNWLYVTDSAAEPTDVVTDSLGNVYINGRFNGTVDFDAGPGVSIHTAPALYPDHGGFVYKLDPDGNFIWSAAIESPFQSRVFDCLPYSKGDLIVFAYFTNAADVAPGPATHPVSGPPGYRQLLLTKWNRECNVNVSLDSLVALNCAGDPGFASISVDGPYPPFDLLWGTTPASTDTFAVLPADMLYSLSIKDATGCAFTSWVKPGGPSTFGGFDFEPYMVVPTILVDTSTFTLLGVNQGCDTLAGSLSLVLDTLLDFISSAPPPDFVIGDTLRWLTPPLSYGMTPFSVSMQIAPDIGTPAFSITSTFISMDPVFGDADTTNNVKWYHQKILAAFDPNSKEVFPAGECEPHYVTIGTQLEYTIHFQNLGTAPAENVVVLDTLDPWLDPATITIVSHSHTVHWDLLPGNVIRFSFPSIFLPDSSSDPAGSKGHILFEVNHLPSIPSGTKVNNRASIHFDYQPPVLTPTVFNTFVDSIPVHHIASSAFVCPGESFTFPDGTTFTAVTSPTTHTSHLLSMAGCDSIIVTTLSLSPTPLDSVTASVCPGGDYVFPDGTTLTSVTSPTTHTSHLHTTLGCDSTVVTYLSLSPTYLDSVSAGVCPGGDFTFPDGTTAVDILSAVTHTSHLTSSLGCDSIVVVTVNLVIVDTSVSLIGGATLHANASPATYMWFNCTTNLVIPGFTSASYTPPAGGSFAVIVQQGGCRDTSSCHDVVLTHAMAVQSAPDILLVPNPATDHVALLSGSPILEVAIMDLMGHELSLTWQTASPDRWDASVGHLADGVYMVKVTTQQGTDSRRLILMK